MLLQERELHVFATVHFSEESDRSFDQILNGVPDAQRVRNYSLRG